MKLQPQAPPPNAPPPWDALEGKGPQRRPQKRLGRRLEEVAKAVGGGYKCHFSWPLLPGRQWLGIGWAPWMGGGVPSPLSMHPCPPPMPSGELWTTHRTLYRMPLPTASLSHSPHSPVHVYLSVR